MTFAILFFGSGKVWAVNYLHFNTPVRVLIERNLSTVDITGDKGLTIIPENSATRTRPTFTGSYAFVDGVPLVCAFERCFRSLSVSSPNRFLKIQGHDYTGNILIVPNSRGLNIIAEVPLEDYVASIVSSEMPPEWDMESLKAQAVAARSYVLYMKQHPRSRQYDVERTVADQVFSAEPSRLKRPLAAAIATSGTILETSGDVLKALYHSRCGGMTESSSAIWRGNARQKFRPVVCPYCQRHPYQWKTQIRWREVLDAFHLDLPLDSRVAFALSEISSTGRAKSIAINSGGETREISTDAFRNFLGYKRIKSALFEGVGTRDLLILKGSGAGHGVGMCQWGARYLAKSGKTFRDILMHYYPLATLARH